MLRNAWQEVRQHPGRVFATLVAIAISVAFIAASSIFLETEKQGLGKQLSMQTSSADIVVNPDFSGSEVPNQDPAQILASITSVPGVDAAEPMYGSVSSLTHGDKVKQLQTMNVPSEKFRFSKITDGRWAEKLGEVTLPKDIAKDLGVKTGDKVEVDTQPATVVGISDDPSSFVMKYFYLPKAAFEKDGGGAFATYAVKVKPGTDRVEVATEINSKVKGFKAQDAEEYRQETFKDLAGGVDVFKYMFGVFQALALLVGMIIIANTFTILITQRRRQIGLLRAVGASSGQVQNQFFAEALLLGLIGGLLGLVLGGIIAAIGSAFTGALQFGYRVPFLDLGIALAIGIVVTIIAAVVPIMKTTRVAPLEALRPVLSADAQKRVSRTRAIICGILLVIGVAMAIISQFIGKDAWPVVWAMGGLALITIAVLAGAPLYVAAMLKGVGKLIAGFGPTSRLATMNSARNPQRAASTAVALMLAMGLIVALQVGTASIRHTIQLQIDKHYPVDLIATQQLPFDQGGATPDSYPTVKLSPNAQKTLSTLPNMKAKSELSGGTVTESGTTRVLYAGDSNLSQAAPSLPVPADDQVVIGEGGSFKDGSKRTYQGKNGKTVTLTVKTAKGISAEIGLVSASTLKTLVDDPQPVGYIFKAADRGDMGDAYAKVQGLMFSENFELNLDGGAMMSSLLNSVLNVLLAVLTGLLGVAVAIALVGVANTLGLSVIERQRESALLRALGMQRTSLRWMLLIEALMLALAGTLVGLIGGTLFSVILLRAVFRNIDISTDYLRYTMDPWQTLGLLAIAAVCAALASILPGRRAALASPTEALAED